MSKILLFVGLTWLFGSPIIAIIVLLIVVYALERRFIGMSPSIVRPFRRRGSISKWRRQLHLSPHDVSAKSELARLLIESKRYGQAKEILSSIESRMEHSAEYWSDLGACDLALGHAEDGEREMLRALSISPRVKYGQPYLKLAESLAKREPVKAIGYLRQFKEVNSSSCEAYYRLGTIYADLGNREEASGAYAECLQLYRSLPKYLRRHERKWALRSFFRNR
ncbi:tetratricopeptide repeat protein [Cohnella endophytica]|uniref:Tetratricopeptide repeat protein n=1 Tax=Cohnella endophytica TaxID=2419778 RepID=A0A494X576_9BACL|nr:tetratricopeptide repeat protein [Cohnella endophytica]RKP45855.1 tetratricopeptide repeat protein [Cohnella endophytica]